jgi:NADH dehydrogenase
VLARDFRSIDPATSRVVLLEGAGRVLPSYPEDLSAKAEQQLRKLGVEVRTGSTVTGMSAHGVTAGAETISAAVALWAAGVKASPMGAALGVPLDKAGRVMVEPDCSLPGHPEVFVIGDLAAMNGEDGKPLPGLAPVAMQMGRATAENILRDLQHEPRRSFHYHDKGMMATIGRAAAVGVSGKVHFSGLTAWLAWLFIHIFYLIGFRNRVLVVMQWAWAYLRFESAARLITGEGL